MSRKRSLWLVVIGISVGILLTCAGVGLFSMREVGPLRFVQYLPGKNDEYRLLCVSHSGKWACLGGGLFSGHPTSIDLAEFGEKCVIQPFGTMNQYGAGDACFSADDQLLATSWSREINNNSTGELAVWSVSTKKQLWTITTEKVTAPYVRLLFSADGKVLYSAGPGFSLHQWDVRDGTYLGQRGEHRELIYAVDGSSDGKYVAAASFDGTVSLWNVENANASERRVSAKSGRLGDLRFSRAGIFAAVGAGDREQKEVGGISIWQSEDAQLVKKIVSLGADNIDFSADGQWMLEAGGGIWHNSYLRVWETSSWNMVAERKFSHVSRAMQVRFLGTSTKFVVGWNNGNIELWDFRPDQIER